MNLVDEQHGLGWHPDLPDIRDYSAETKEVKASILGIQALNSKDINLWEPGI